MVDHDPIGLVLILTIHGIQRCDGNRPVCGQCSRRSHLGVVECEYADFDGKTESEVLQDRISGLENRIRELQAPQGSSTFVPLAHPYPEVSVSSPTGFEPASLT